MSHTTRSSDSYSDQGGRRQSSIVRAASSIRASAASAVSAVEENIEVGTVGGTALNTTCNVIGAGVLALPLAGHNAGLGWAVLLVISMGAVGAFAAYVIFVGCDRTGAYFLNEVFSIAVVGRPSTRYERPVSVPTKKGSMADPDSPLIAHHHRRASSIARARHHHAAGGETADGKAMSARAAKDTDAAKPAGTVDYGASSVEQQPATPATAAATTVKVTSAFDEADGDVPEGELRRRKMRLVLSLIIDTVVFLNNYSLLAVYSRVIIDSIPPVLVQFLHISESSIWVSEGFWCIFPGVIFFGLTSVRNMAELKWSSILGIATILFAAFAIVIEFGRLGYQGDYTPGDKRNVNEWSIYGTFPATLATLTMAYSYHFNAPIFYHELEDRTPRKMMQTVAISFPTIGTTYLFVAIFGYLSFGDHVADESAGGDVINNYQNNNTLINCVRLGLFFHFVCVYPVMSVCVRHSFHRFVLTALGRREEATHPDMPARVPRVAIVIEAFLLVSTSSAFACFYSNIGQLIIVVGALCGATLMLTVPGIIGLCIWGPHRDKHGLVVSAAAAGNAEPASDRPLIPEMSHSDSMLDSSLEQGVRGLPPFYHRRLLMTVLCGSMSCLGIFCTFAAFSTAVFGV